MEKNQKEFAKSADEFTTIVTRLGISPLIAKLTATISQSHRKSPVKQD